MKKLDIERLLSLSGYCLVRENKHSVWTNGQITVTIPRHKHINRLLAKKVLKQINYFSNVPEINYFT